MTHIHPTRPRALRLILALLLLAATPAAAQVSGGKVTLDDREPHTWSYYSDASLPTQLRSLNPADVTITYHGLGSNTVTAASATEAVDRPTSFSRNATGVKVNYDAADSVFIYHKTLERTSGSEYGSATYAYTTIPNPFQVRPTGNSGSVTVTPDTRTVYISWSSTYWTRNANQATVRFSYTNADGVVQTSGNYTSNGNTTVQAKVGTKITVYSKSCRNGYTDYSPTITARYDNGSGTQIVSYRNTSTTENSSTSTNNITASSSTFTASKYRGFYKWRIKKITGGSIKSADGSVTYTQYSGSGAVASTNMLDAEETYHFIPSAATGMSVDLEALWAQAYVSTSGAEAHNVGVERNFYVINTSNNSNITAGSYPCTYTSLYPNGTTDETSAATSVTVYKYGGFTAAADSKIENIILRNNNSTITAAGHNLTIGRGVTPYNENDGCANDLFGLNADGTTSFSMRIESGKFANLYFLGQGQDFTNDAVCTSTLGCDYDRAKVKGGDNSFNQKLRVTTDIAMGKNATTGRAGNPGAEVFHCIVKSGNFDLGTSNYGGGYQFYISAFGDGGTPYTYGKRTLIVEGGVFSDMSGGMETDGVVDNSVQMVDIRIKGGTVNSIVYGAAQYSGATGERRIVFTGGIVKGWIAGGCNGTRTNGGELYGDTYIYFGGNAEVGDENGGTHVGGNVSYRERVGYNYNYYYGINGADGGSIFGAGCGINPTDNNYVPNGNYQNTTVGRVDNSNVVIADEAIVWRDVYGGGNFGWVRDNGTSNIKIIGGTVKGNVYGGSNNQKGQTVNIEMTGGAVEKGIYGGSNSWGVVTGPVSIDIIGGTVGTSGINAETSEVGHVFGSGYGAGTSVTGNVVVTIGDATDSHKDSPLIHGNVYGGGHAAPYTSTGKTFQVIGQNGLVKGSIFGGGKGSSAVVTGPTDVRLKGHIVVESNVFGGGHAATVTGDTHVTMSDD